MNIEYNITGPERKVLAKTVSEILGCEVIYKGAPTFAYALNNYVIDKHGTLSCADDVSSEELDRLTAALKERGYEPELEAKALEFAVEIPRDGSTDDVLENLRKIVTSKETLIRKAIGAEALPIEVGETTLRFPWFTLSGADSEADAYTRFIHALYEMAKTQKRVTAKARETENDKFTMRVFLIRLGFIGEEYKTARKILLQNLIGNSSWKNGQPPEKAEGSTL